MLCLSFLCAELLSEQGVDDYPADVLADLQSNWLPDLLTV